MKTIEEKLDLQALADGELTPARQAELEQRLATDPGAAALVKQLRAVRELVRTHEPLHTVPASRDFYWSQIRRRMTESERTSPSPARPSAPSSGFHWFRWLLPIGGVAALAVAVTLSLGRFGTVKTGENLASETGSDASGAVMFRSDSEGVTICWLD